MMGKMRTEMKTHHQLIIDMDVNTKQALEKLFSAMTHDDIVAILDRVCDSSKYTKDATPSIVQIKTALQSAGSRVE